MLPKNYSISAVPAKKFNTPLKSSVVLLTSVLLASVSASAADTTLQPNITNSAITNPDIAPQTALTGFQSNALSDNNLIGSSILYGAIRDNSIGSPNSYDQLNIRANETDSREFKRAILVNLTGANDTDYGNDFKQHNDQTHVTKDPGVLRDLSYTSIYKNFDDQIQIGHVYGDPKLRGTNSKLARLSNVYVQGNATNVEDTDYLKQWSQYNTDNKISDGKVSYAGVATYMEGLHLYDGDRNGPVVDGTSKFAVDFVEGKVDGELSFKNGDYKYMPEGNKIAIKADITGNNFAGNNDGIDTAGGFYGEDAQLLGGTYQEAKNQGGEGKGAGQGTTFQGTYGASKTTKTLEPPTNPNVAAEAQVTGVHSSALGNDNLIGPSMHYGAIRDNKTSRYDELSIRANETDSREYYAAVDVKLTGVDDTQYDNGFKLHTDKTLVKLGPILRRDLEYSSVYKDFDNDMQIGHVYGDPKVRWTSIRPARLSNVYVQGNATSLEDMQYMKKLSQYKVDSDINDGSVQYAGVATYMENLHLKDGQDRNGPTVDGTSKFNVDFVQSKLEGELSFKEGNYTYMPEDNKISIKADINGNTFAGNVNNIDTAGGFYGEDAKLLGGVYQQALTAGGVAKKKGEGTTFQGTFGANKISSSISTEPAAPEPTESDMTGFQSTALSSKFKNLPFGLGQLQNAIGYVQIRDDKSSFTATEDKDGSLVPVDNREGDNFNSFNKGTIRADMVKPDSVLKPIQVSLTNGGSIKVDAGKGGQNPTFNYNAVYKNFDSQMQVGHVYGNFNSLVGDVSRAANVYVEGYLTSQFGMGNLKQVNDGKAQYQGMATYIENIHLDDNSSTAPVFGTSNFESDFVNNKVNGTLLFDAGNYKYMPAGNKIDIEASITGNTFVGNTGQVDIAGGFYGKEGNFLGGIYQDASVEGGKGTVAGTGTKFQGTFGAEKQ